MNKIQKLSKNTTTLTVAVTGTLKKDGWLPGTFVYFVNESTDPTFIKPASAIALVDKWSSQEGADGTKPNHPAGFLLTGSVGNDDSNYMTALNPTSNISFDENNLVKTLSVGCATLVIGSTGIFKIYQYEKNDSNGVPIVYNVGDALYASPNNLLTNEVFVNGLITGERIGYQIAVIDRDDEGDFLIISNVSF